MRLLAMVVLVGAALLISGCQPNASWSKARLQGWADKNFPDGTPRSEVVAKLREVPTSRRHVGYSEQDNPIMICLPMVWRPPMTAWEATIAFGFGADDLLESREVTRGFVGP